jgi:two-component system, sensor histidine kinase
MKLLKQPVSNRAVLAVIGLLVGIALLWVYFGYALLKTETPVQATVAAPDELYYVPVTEFERAALKAENAVLRYGAGAGSLTDISITFQVLESKLKVLSDHSDATRVLQQVPGYQEAMRKLNRMVWQIGNKLDVLQDDRTRAVEIADEFAQLRGPSSDIEVSVGNVEAAARDRLYREDAARRRLLLAASYGCLIVGAVLVGFLFINMKRVRALAAQREAAFEREQEATKAAQEAVQVRNTFLGMIGHELRTPLQSITAAIDVLSGREFSGPDGQLIQRLARAADQLDAQMKDLSDFSRINAGKLRLRKQVFVPRDVLNAAVESVTLRAHRKGLELDVAMVGADGQCVSDPNRVQQVVTNLLTNAIKYTDKGKVTLRARVERARSADRLTIEVSDTGPGIASDKLDRIFEPFTQIDSSSTRKVEGVGMGLAIVRGLVTLLGGRVSVVSAQGKGSQFVVVLPLERRLGMLGRSNLEDGVAYRIEDKRLLVVDDHEDVRAALREMLMPLGVRFTLAGSADEALRQLSQHRFDAMLLDVNMPERDGLEVARILRADSGPNQRIPIVGISALAPELLTTEQRMYFGEYLMKPIRSDQLREAIDRLFGGGTRLGR